MTQLNYQLTSQDPSKPYLILLHGLFGNLDNLAMVRREFVDSHNVLSVDLPDHGKSMRSTEFSFQHYAHSIVSLIDELSIDKSQILGHSLGGKVAMQVALQFPHRVEKLVVADIAPVAYSPRHHNVFSALNSVDLNTLTSRTEATEILSKHLKEPGVSQFLLKGLTQVDGKWQWQFNLAMLERDYAQLSQAIDTQPPFMSPTLFVKGGKSDYILAEHRDAIMALFPNSQAKIIGSAGHWLHAEKPQIFNRLVSEFLANT
ncbi:alpha/beta fold hydrolase [Aliiglaciecola litoralis]|uniref:Alpha/beta fold hydrolase n=1 Tax=Aliiglaciecola litoralis TaxID=582857 RepID=A0ABN1LCH3_9ALTE